MAIITCLLSLLKAASRVAVVGEAADGQVALEMVRNTYFNAQCVRLDGAIRLAPR